MGLKRWWPLDNDFCDIIVDIGNSESLTINGTENFVETSIKNNGFKFNNSYLVYKNDIDDERNVDNRIFYDNMNEYSISLWIKFEDVTSTQCLYSCRTVPGSGIALFRINNGLRCDSGSSWSYEYNFNTDTWYNIIYARTKTKQYLYINNELVNLTNENSTNEVSNLDNIDTEFIIGASKSNDVISNYLNGTMFDFKIYDHCISKYEVNENYNQTLTYFNINYMDNLFIYNNDKNMGFDKATTATTVPSTSYTSDYCKNIIITATEEITSSSIYLDSHLEYKISFYYISSCDLTISIGNNTFTLSSTSSWKKFISNSFTISSLDNTIIITPKTNGSNFYISSIKITESTNENNDFYDNLYYPNRYDDDTISPVYILTDSSPYRNVAYSSTPYCFSPLSPIQNKMSLYFENSTANKVIKFDKNVAPKVQKYTISCWVKFTNNVGSVITSNVNPNIKVFDAKDYELNTWYFVTAVVNVNYISTYVNGIKTIDSEYNNLLLKNIIIGKFDGYICNFRILCGCLSDTKIKELFSNKSVASLDDSGILYCNELKQKSSDLTSATINKEGICLANRFDTLNTNDMDIQIVKFLYNVNGVNVYYNTVWAKIFYHKLNSGNYFTQDNSQDNSLYLRDDANSYYSHLQYANEFKSKDGKYEFILRYGDSNTIEPLEDAINNGSISSNTFFRWTQTSDITDTKVENFSAITNNASSYGLIGIHLNSSSSESKFLVGSNRGLICQYKDSSNFTLDKNDSSSNYVELWIRIDNVQPKKIFRIFKNKSIQAYGFGIK